MRKLINVFFVAAGLLFTANVASAQQKIAHLDSESIFASMPEAKTATASLETLQKQKQAEIEKMQAEYTTKYEAAVAKNKTLSEANKEIVGKELQAMGVELDDMKKRIGEATQKAQQDIATKQGELLAPLNTKFITAVKAVSKEKGYAYVFDISSQQGANNLLAWEGGDDVTAAVKAKLGISATAAAPKK
ncbi:OmpH family outer membrane protein [Pedobacter sp. MR2016-24]|uniref:OmpH family outer membrane protein n=1 Tax=Pedobacter sp. MR2016-24 TaxID=2994466 RepID=UPI0022465166|nr:OmpH family outer membrane protein [Pedobacter sp. MR2016-24]MCX2482647.1 OmpH family outer membrane protein [Pedobacter sp. MR2016-24]MDO7745111.1 OmpH family outer membrane protein [Pedobacter sp.]